MLLRRLTFQESALQHQEIKHLLLDPFSISGRLQRLRGFANCASAIRNAFIRPICAPLT